MREAFARAPGEGDPEAERAFLASRIELLRGDASRSDAQRAAAIAELEAKLRSGRETQADQRRRR